MASNNFFWFLSKSMEMLKVEAYASYSKMVMELGDLRAMISCDEKRTVYFDQTRFVISDDTSRIDVETSFNSDTVTDLIDGKYSIVEALLSEKLKIQGKITAINKFHIAVNAYLNGALRSPKFLQLLSEYRRSLSRGG